ncbi:MAG: hypothetical protein COC03_03705 [Robiginitomaculum sp.]|nr:MAG: hypothetical protein COC03_03705 [Robiginitomaculum sp.]PHQ67926.1 MAG: hypothetical protein COB92_02530 [Robiginitomaculum sp.]
MKMLTTLRAATLATLAGAAISLPTLAQATDNNRGYYDPGQKCRSQENDAQLIGGLLGAVVGGVAGSQVSGNGARTEGSIIGAVLGGIAGAAIGDESVDCDKRRRVGYSNTNTTYSGQTYGRTVPIVYGGTVATRRVSQPRRTYSTHNGYRNNGYNNVNYTRVNELRAQLGDVRYRLHELRDKDRRLERRLRREYRPRLAQKQEWVHKEIHRLERKERRLKKRLRKQRRSY